MHAGLVKSGPHHHLIENWEHFSPDFEGPFRPSRQLSKSSAREKNQVQ
jgi:hypothetical protein